MGSVCGVRAAPAVVAGALALVAAGCGGGGEAPSRPALVERLAALCEETRIAVEELGEPKDTGAAVFRPWAAIGRRFVADVRRLGGTSARQREQLQSLAGYYEGFYDSLALSYELHEGGQQVAIKMTLERAYALLDSADALAIRMGATECAVRPFADT